MKKHSFHITNLDRAIHLWELLSQPYHAELYGYDPVKDWPMLLNEADKALKLAIKEET